MVNVALNITNTITTGCLKPTPVGQIQILSGVAPSDIRREVATMVERNKKLSGHRHLMFGEVKISCRLKSRKLFKLPGELEN